jgi:DNA polymerase III gamma/tau subunit
MPWPIKKSLPGKSWKEFIVNYDKLKQQSFAIRILKAHIKWRRLAPTYLLTGEKESGKKDLTMSFACALLCAAKKEFEACACIHCSRIIRHNHPDVKWLGESNARSIKIEEVRELIHWASLKPYEGKWKIFILVDADRLTLEASNALLKTLEEPPAQTIFCLLAESRAQLLETIQSRSFEIRLRPSGKAEVQDPEIQSAVRAAMKSPNWDDYFESFQGGARDALKDMLDCLMLCFRDSLHEASLGSPSGAFLIPAHLQAFYAAYESKEALEANANQKLVLSRLAMQLRKELPSALIHPREVEKERKGE